MHTADFKKKDPVTVFIVFFLNLMKPVPSSRQTQPKSWMQTKQILILNRDLFCGAVLIFEW